MAKKPTLRTTCSPWLNSIWTGFIQTGLKMVVICGRKFIATISSGTEWVITMPWTSEPNFSIELETAPMHQNVTPPKQQSRLLLTAIGLDRSWLNQATDKRMELLFTHSLRLTPTLSQMPRLPKLSTFWAWLSVDNIKSTNKITRMVFRVFWSADIQVMYMQVVTLGNCWLQWQLKVSIKAQLPQLKQMDSKTPKTRLLGLNFSIWKIRMLPLKKWLKLCCLPVMLLCTDFSNMWRTEMDTLMSKSARQQACRLQPRI